VKEKLTGPEGTDWLIGVLWVLAHQAVASEKADAKSKADACLTNGTFMVFISRSISLRKMISAERSGVAPPESRRVFT
jgi:hypothetical protein